MSKTRLSGLASFPSYVTPVMDNVNPSLQPAPWQEGGGGGALMERADIPPNNGSDTQFFQER